MAFKYNRQLGCEIHWTRPHVPQARLLLKLSLPFRRLRFQIIVYAKPGLGSGMEQ